MTSTLIRALVAVDGEPEDADSFDLSRAPSTEATAYRLALASDELDCLQASIRDLQAQLAR